MNSHSVELAGLALEQLEADRLSHRVIKIRHQGPALADIHSLQTKAERICAEIAYLDEALRLVENDPVREAVVLRSENPHIHDDGCEFYELRVQQNGETELQRLRYQREENNQAPRDMIFTTRQLERLGADLKRLSEI